MPLAVRTRGEMGHRGPSREAEPCLLLSRAARAARATGAGARPLCRGPAGFGGAWAAGYGARQAARRAQDGGALRCQFGPAPTSRLDLCGRLDEAREYRLASQKRMELIGAVKNQDVEKVEVRRPLEAGSSTESGPSRGVCLGLGRWTLDAVVARPIRPCCVESSPYVMHQSGDSDAACRRSSMTVRTSRSVARTLPCRLAESHNFSPPPSPASAVPATFLSLPRLMDTRAGCEMATTPSPLVSALYR